MGVSSAYHNQHQNTYEFVNCVNVIDMHARSTPVFEVAVATQAAFHLGHIQELRHDCGGCLCRINKPNPLLCHGIHKRSQHLRLQGRAQAEQLENQADLDEA